MEKDLSINSGYVGNDVVFSMHVCIGNRPYSLILYHSKEQGVCLFVVTNVVEKIVY